MNSSNFGTIFNILINCQSEKKVYFRPCIFVPVLRVFLCCTYRQYYNIWYRFLDNGIMQRKFREIRHLLTDKKRRLFCRMQWYITGVVSTALQLHNVGSWLIAPRVQRRLNGTNSRLLSKITNNVVSQEACMVTMFLCRVMGSGEEVKMIWTYFEGGWIVHSQSCCVASIWAWGGGYPHGGDTSTQSETSNTCARLRPSRTNAGNGGVCNAQSTRRNMKVWNSTGSRQSLRVGGQEPYDRVPPDVLVSPPVPLGGAAAPREHRTNNPNLVRDLTAEAMVEVSGCEVEDRDRPMDSYINGSCLPR